MPYVTYPTWARRGERLALVARYLPILGLASADLFIFDEPIPKVVSLLAVLATGACVTGAAFRRYHVEWIGMSLLALVMLVAIGFMVPYVPGVMIWLSVSLTLSLGDRWVRLARESWLAREELRLERKLRDGE